MPAVFRGESARLEWGYYTAATLGRWTLTIDRGTPDDPHPLTRRLVATVLGLEAYRVRQRPLVFVVPRPGRGPWRFPVLTLELRPGALVGELGAKEDPTDVPIRTAGK